LVFHCIDVLAGIAMAQIVRPGAPVLFGGAPATFHMKAASSPMLAIEALHLDVAYVNVAKRLGLDSYDIKNLRAGNLPSLDMVLKLVTKGRFSPESIIYGRTFKKLSPGVSTKNAQPRLINTRIRKLASSKPAQEWGNATGLAVHSIYQLRVSGARAGLHTVLGFLNAGIPLEEVFFGKKPRKKAKKKK